MNWNCEHIETHLSDYVDQLLDLEQQRLFISHVAGCSHCKKLVAQVSGVVTQMHHLPPVEEPPRLTRLILEATLGSWKTATGWRKFFLPLRPVFQPRFAVGALAMLLVLTVVSNAMGIEWSKVQAADLRPDNLYREANRRSHLMYARSVKFVNDLRVVYEIQSRLQTPQEQQPPQPQPAAPGSSEKEPGKREREINRADEWKSIPVVLAMAAPAGSVR